MMHLLILLQYLPDWPCMDIQSGRGKETAGCSGWSTLQDGVNHGHWLWQQGRVARAYQDSNGGDVEVRLSPFHCAFSFNNYYQSHHWSHNVVLILLLHCLSRVRQASPLSFPLFLHSCPNPSKSICTQPSHWSLGHRHLFPFALWASAFFTSRSTLSVCTSKPL